MMLGPLELRDTARIFTCLALLLLAQWVVFRRMDNWDVTQMWIASCTYAIICAVRET